MDKAVKETGRVVPVLSSNYLSSDFTPSEWDDFFRRDPRGDKRLIVPVRVGEVDLKGLLGPIVYINILGLAEDAAQQELLAGVKRGRVKPKVTPTFPGSAERSVLKQPRFPGEGVNSTGLEVRFLGEPPYWIQQVNREHYRLGIYNYGPDVANNVKVWLDDITPRPRDPRFDVYSDFPYSRQPVGEETGDRNINPNDEMLFQIVSWWVGGQSPQAGLQIGNLMVDNLGPTSFLIEPDEQWNLYLRVSSGNYGQHRAILVMYVDEGAVRLYLDESPRGSIAPTGPLEPGSNDVPGRTGTTITSSIIPPLPGFDPRAGRPTDQLALLEAMQRLILELKGNIGLTGWGIGEMPTDRLERLRDQPEYLQFPVELQQAIETVARRSRGLKSMPQSSATVDHANYVPEAESLVFLLERFLSGLGRSK